MAYIASSAASNATPVSATLVQATGVAASLNDMIIVFAAWALTSTTLVSVTDDKGNTYTSIGSIAGNNCIIQAFWAKAASAGVTTTTVTLSGAPLAGSIATSLFSGRNVATPVTTSITNDQNTPGTGANAVTSGNFTAATNDDVAYGMVVAALISAADFAGGTNYNKQTETNPVGGLDLMLETRNAVSSGTNAAVATVNPDGRVLSLAVSIAVGTGSPSPVASPLDLLFTGRQPVPMRQGPLGFTRGTPFAGDTSAPVPPAFVAQNAPAFFIQSIPYRPGPGGLGGFEDSGKQFWGATTPPVPQFTSVPYQPPPFQMQIPMHPGPGGFILGKPFGGGTEAPVPPAIVAFDPTFFQFLQPVPMRPGPRGLAIGSPFAASTGNSNNSLPAATANDDAWRRRRRRGR